MDNDKNTFEITNVEDISQKMQEKMNHAMEWAHCIATLPPKAIAVALLSLEVYLNSTIWTLKQIPKSTSYGSNELLNLLLQPIICIGFPLVLFLGAVSSPVHDSNSSWHDLAEFLYEQTSPSAKTLGHEGEASANDMRIFGIFSGCLTGAKQTQRQIEHDYYPQYDSDVLGI